MSTINYRIAVQTRGFNEDYRWLGNSSTAEQEASGMGAVLHNRVPGIMVQKYGNDNFGILIADIERPDATDRMGTRIRMQVYVGGLSEAAARSMAVAALENWENIVPLRNAIDKVENELEWDVRFDDMSSTIQSLVDRLSESSASSPFTDRLSGKYDQRDSLISALREHRFSDPTGYKFYWGGIPSKDGEDLRFTVDRYFCTNAVPGVLQDRESPKPAPITDPVRTTKQPPITPPPEPPNEGKPEVSKNVMWGMVTVIILLLVSSMFAKSSLKSQNNALTQQIQKLESTLKNAESQITDLRNELQKTQSSLKNAESQITDLRNELQKTQSSLQNAESQITELQKRQNPPQ